MKTTRKEYITKIWMYKQRRAYYKLNYTGDEPYSNTYGYKKLSMKISQWTKEIKRLDKRNEKIKRLLKSVNNYFDVDIKIKSAQKEVILAKKIYFKIGIESGICGTHLSRYLGKTYINEATYNRRTLTESFKTNPENKKAFHDFKNYLKEKNKNST